MPAFQARYGPMDAYAGHFRRYSPTELGERLVEAQLENVEIALSGWPLAYPLEALRNRIDARKLARSGDVSADVLTSASGRTLQPRGRLAGAAMAAATAPFRQLQRVSRTRGTGLVAVARKR